MNKQQLIEVFEDTRNRVESGDFNSKLKSDLITLSDNILSKKISNTNIDVVNFDCIDIAKNLSTNGKTCLLNMASYKKPGGGVRNGSMAQEEELSRRSNLVWGLPQEYYPLSDSEFIYTKDVTFFKDKDYNMTSEFDCDVITIAAVNLNHGSKVIYPSGYQKLMYRKVENLIYYPSTMGCKNLVLSAFGCGVFKNDPTYVANLFKSILSLGYSSLYENITFAILNDHNSVSSNYEIFKKILLNK